MAADGNSPWEQVPLRTLVSRCDYGLSCSLDGDATGIPVLRMGNLVDGKVRTTGLKYIPATNLPSSDDLLLPGDLLLNRTNSADRVGKIGLFVGGPRITFASYLFRLRAQQETTTPEWLAQVMSSPKYQERLRRLATPGVSQTNINRTALLGLKIPLPPLPEQRKIAAILSSVDDTIEKTQAVIDQLEVVKKGLLGELLTRGMPGRHNEFKDSSLGPIPDDWNASTVAEIANQRPYSCVGGPFGSDLTSKHYSSTGVPVIRGSNLSAAAGRWLGEDGFVFVTEAKADELQRNLAYPGDIVFTQRGTLGQVARIRPSSSYRRLLLSQSQMKLTVDETRADPDFVTLYFLSPHGQSQITRATIATGLPHINLGLLKGFSLPVPSIQEQREIVSRIDGIDCTLSINRAILNTQILLKQGLLDALLSGRVRAPMLAQEAA